jgi:murein DD-endopeptidase MepM/ murein hydrolase activator NlpD
MVDGLKESKYASPFQGKTGFTKVETGDLLGYADNTGFSTANHLHFALKPCAKGEAWGTWMNTELGNGYYGCIDPMPYFDKNYPITIELMKKQITILQQLISLWKSLLGMK